MEMSQNIDVEDSLFISDIEEDINSNKRINNDPLTPLSSPKKQKTNNTQQRLFSRGYLKVNETSEYLTINEYGTVLLLNNQTSKSIHVNFLNKSIANSYDIEIDNDAKIDICVLTSTNLIFVNTESNEVTVRNHYDNEKSTSFTVTGLDGDKITSLTFDTNYYIGTKKGMLMVLNEYGIMTHKRVFVDEINVLDIKFNKLFVVHSNFKFYSIMITANNIKFIHHNVQLPVSITNNDIKNVGISDNNTPWISTVDGFFSLINSYNQNKSYWINALNYENEIYRLNGGFIIHQDEEYVENRIYENHYILPVNMISDYDELILGYVINENAVKLPNVSTFSTSCTPITLTELNNNIKEDESMDDKNFNNLLNCEIDSNSALQLPNYYRQVDNLVQNTIQNDIINSSVLENSMVNEDDSIQLLKNLNNTWDSSVLRLFDIKCQQRDIKCCYSLVLSLKQTKCLDKAKEISKMYGIYELSDKINDLIDSRSA